MPNSQPTGRIASSLPAIQKEACSAVSEQDVTRHDKSALIHEKLQDFHHYGNTAEYFTNVMPRAEADCSEGSQRTASSPAITRDFL